MWATWVTAEIMSDIIDRIMDLIKSVAKRSQLSDVVYILLNLALACGVLLLTIAFQPPYLAYALVLLSKWRVFAVRARYWWANLQTNTVDVLVGASVVTLIWQASGTLLVQTFIALLYAAWLLILKPRSKRIYMIWQAGVAQFLAIMALFSIAHVLDSAVVVAVCYAIGYVCARHVMGAYDDQNLAMLSMIWGFFIAELGWLSYHWTTAYSLTTTLLLPQASIIAALFGFVALRCYDALVRDVPLWRSVKAPVLFSFAVMAILLFSELSAIFNHTA